MGAGSRIIPSQLFAYDAIVLSNVSSRTPCSDQQFAWIEEWIGRRGAGLCMVEEAPTVSPPAAGTAPPSARCFLWSLLPASRDWDEARVGLHVTAAERKSSGVASVIG